MVLGFWIAAGFLAYVYAGYPLLVALVGWTRNRRVRQAEITPRVALVVAAHNEAAAIAAKLENALKLDYPAEQLEIVVASDGSSDGTDAIAARYADRGVVLLSLPRRGKLYALDAGVEETCCEILVFSDANTLLHPLAVRRLVRNFADPEVGGVCGNQVHPRVMARDSSGVGEMLYWSFDKWLKRLESRTGSIVAADGALYAVRRTLYRMPESAAVTDDFAISTAVVAQGRRLVFEPEAVAYERAAGDAAHEFERKVRITMRGLRGVALRRRLLDPLESGFYAVVLLSHKVLRRLAPVGLLALLVCSIALASRSGWFAAAALAQGALYALALAGWLLRGKRVGRGKLFYIPFFFCLANAAALVGLLKVASGRRVERWEPRRPAIAT